MSIFCTPKTLSRAVPWLILACVLVFVCVVYVTQKWVPSATAARTAHLDGYYYYTYLRSLVFDGDLDLTNDYALLHSNIFSLPVNAATGKPENMFTIGSALFWMPFAAFARLVLPASQGVDATFQEIVFFGSLVYGFASVVLMFLINETAFRRSDALLSALAGLFCTPLYWFMTRQACYSHAISAFTSAVLVLTWLKTYGSWTTRRWLLLGLMTGAAMTVRPQAAVHLIVPFLEIAFAAARCVRAKEQRTLLVLTRACLVLALGLLIGFAPQAAAWKAIYGAYGLIPQGNHFMHWSGSRYGAALFSSWNGWSAWHPLVSVGLLGLLIGNLRPTSSERTRRLAQGAVLVVAAQAFLNGAAGDWSAGWAFGGRRFTDCTVYVAFGLAHVFSLLGDKTLHAALSRALRLALPLVLVVAFGLLSCNLGERYLRQEVPLDYPFRMLPFWQEAVTRGMAAVYEVTGNWGSIPANWVYASAGMVPPSRYDLASTWELHGSTEIPFFDSPRVLGGFGAATSYRGRPCRWLLSREGRFEVVVRETTALRATATLSGSVPGTTVRMSLDGHTLLEVAVANEFQSYSFEVPASSLSTGSNYVRIEQNVPKVPPRPVGKTGVSLEYDLTVRSAGWDAGNAASLVVGSREIPVAARGLSLFTIGVEEKKPKLVGEYDTFALPDAVAKFAKDVGSLADGTIVVLVARDDTAPLYAAIGDAAIRSLGGARSLMNMPRASYALVGLKGAKSGSAVEELSLKSPVQVTVGRPLSSRVDGTAWQSIKLDVVE